jgi:hypothetical protein
MQYLRQYHHSNIPNKVQREHVLPCLGAQCSQLDSASNALFFGLIEQELRCARALRVSGAGGVELRALGHVLSSCPR